MGEVAVVVLTLNQRDTTLRCLESLCQMSIRPLHVFVLDNGSTDDTIGAVRQAYPDVETYYSPSNLGVASGRNEAARRAIDLFDPEFLLFLDNDIIVKPDYVEALLVPFSESPRVGQVQSKLLLLDSPETINDGGGVEINFLTAKTRPVGFGKMDRGQYDVRKECVACGGAMMVRAELFQALGGFDSTFDPVGPEDIDFSLRLRKAGYIAIYEPAAVAYHAVSHTYGKGYTTEYARSKAANWLTFLRRHAPRWKIFTFLTVTAPLIALKVSIREIRRGNFGALAGLARGISDVARRSRAGNP